ncbi:MAG: hypothetical protein HUU54_07635 [Ignavibacteriaceae bacterium]|nr:hypothetical protein [Ignavibacteriaceae bacterium]
MKAAILQYSPEWENKKANEDKIKSLMDSSFSGADILIMPEMTLTGFSMRSSELAEGKDGKSVEFFRYIAEAYQTSVIAGYILKSGKSIYNTLVHVSPQGQVIASYNKIHPFSFSGEDKYYSAGKKTVISEYKGWKIGLSVCYDLRFPELFRQYAKENVDLIINIANWPVPRVHHYTHLLKARAIENLCYVIGVNRVGPDPKSVYNGQSSVYAPLGEEVVTLIDMEQIRTVILDRDLVLNTKTKFPFLNDIKLM